MANKSLKSQNHAVVAVEAGAEQVAVEEWGNKLGDKKRGWRPSFSFVILYDSTTQT
ncbi:hypothetical protein D3C73_1060580 [compost metagenome]